VIKPIESSMPVAETTTLHPLVLESFAMYPAAAGLDLAAEIIACTPYSNIVEYIGTWAALESEGLIPSGTTWPESFNDLQWESGSSRYWLRRQRPEGVKGPRKLFVEVDWWCLRIDPVCQESVADQAIRKKAKALADEIYRQSAEGKREWFEMWRRHDESRKDAAFQAFKARIPGLVLPRRCRKAVRHG